MKMIYRGVADPTEARRHETPARPWHEHAQPQRPAELGMSDRESPLSSLGEWILSKLPAEMRLRMMELLEM